MAGGDEILLIQDRTRHLIGPAALARLRPGALILNCARGGLIDEEALLGALEEGTVGGAALDVFEQDPPRDRRGRVSAFRQLGRSVVG